MLVLLRYPSPKLRKEECGFHQWVSPVLWELSSVLGHFPLCAGSPGGTEAESSRSAPSPNSYLRDACKNGCADRARPFCNWDQGRLAGVLCTGEDSYPPLESLLGSREYLEKQLLKCNLPGDQGSCQQWQVMLVGGCLDMMRWEGHLNSVVFLPRTYNPSLFTWEKHRTNPSRWTSCKIPNQNSS